MKKTIFTLAVLTVISGILMMSCKSSTEGEKEAQEKVQDAKDSLAVAKKAATAEEWKGYKLEMDSVINDNKTRIAELKLKIKKTGKSVDAQYQENIEILEQKNKNLKVTMDTYKNDANSDWQSFKREFKHDMDELGQAFKDLTVNNKK